MVSSVRSRPSHYEVLGLSPSASAAEVAQAFAAKMSLFGAHPVAEVAQLGIAYETLRDPARRRAYDASLRPSPAPKLGYTARWSAVPLARPTDDRFRGVVAQAGSQPRPEAPAEPHVTAEPTLEAPVDPRVAAIAASLRELAKPGSPEISPGPKPKVEERPRPEPKADADLEAVVQHIREFGRAEKERLRDAQPRSVNWKRAAFAMGGLILGAGLIGTLAGLSVKDNAATSQAEPAVSTALPAATVALPPAKPGPEMATVPEPDRAVGTGMRTGPTSRARRTASPQRSTGWADQMAENLSEEGTALASEQAATEPRPARMVAASLPLPDAAIARTIGRIGYACGEVASTTPVDGAPGVFKVTCTSGHSYQATPVRGRYHFRRMGSR